MQEYKINVIAGTKLLANMVESVKDTTFEVTETVKTVAGGVTQATAVVLAPGVEGKNQKMEKVVGWFKNATGSAWEAPKDADNTNWWDGSLWALGGSVAWPKGKDGKTIEPFDDLKIEGYKSGDSVFFGKKTFLALVDASQGESPESHPIKWEWKSGGVDTISDGLEKKQLGTIDYIYFPGTGLNRKYINQQGKLTPIVGDDLWYYDFIAVNPGDRIIGTMHGNAAYLVYAFYTTQNESSFVYGISANGSTLPRTIDVEISTKGYIRLWSRVNIQYVSFAKIIRAQNGALLTFRQSLDRFKINNRTVNAFPTASINNNYDVVKLSTIKENIAFNVTAKTRESAFNAKDGVETFVTNDGITHPGMLYFPGGWRGFEFWGVITPYRFGGGGTGESIENPAIVRGNWNVNKTDIVFEQPSGINPIVNAPYNAIGYWSDNNLAIDNKGVMYLTWRGTNIPSEYLGEPAGITYERVILYKTSIDGVNWSNTKTILKTSDAPDQFGKTNDLLSPVLNYVDGVWHLYYVTKNAEGLADANNGANQDGWYLVRRVADRIEDLKNRHTKDDYINFDQKIWPETAISGVWHFDVKKVGNTFFLVANWTTRTDGFSGGGMTFYYSTDNKNFKKIQNLYGQDSYRPCFVPISSSANSLNFLLFRSKVQTERVDLVDLTINWSNI